MSLVHRLRGLFGHTLRADPPEDPRRDPDWCWTHGKKEKR